MSRLSLRILHILTDLGSNISSDSWTLPAWLGDSGAMFRSAFRKSMDAHLFECYSMNARRLGMSVATFCEVGQFHVALIR